MRVVWVAVLLIAALGAGVALVGLGTASDSTGLQEDDAGRGAADPALEARADQSPRNEADTLFERGEVDVARARYAAALEEDPNDAEAHLRLTLIALLRYDREAAAYHGNEVVRLDPASPEATATSAALAVSEASDDEAVAIAIESARAVLEDRPDLLLARWVLAWSLAFGDDPCKAVTEIDAAIAEAPNLYEFEEMRLAAFQRAGDRGGSIAQVERMHRKFPDNVQVSEWLFEIYDGTGDVTAATAILRKLAENASEDPAPGLSLVDYIRATDGDEAADAELSRLAENAAGTSVAGRLRVELASSLFRQGQETAAIRVLEALLDLPTLTLQQNNDAKVELARMLEATGHSDRAPSLIDEVLKADPAHVGALKARASALIDEGKPRDALAVLRAALDQSPNAPDLLILSAAAHQLEGSDALAGDTLARAVEASGGGVEETELFARFLREQGRTAAADAALATLARPSEAEDGISTGGAEDEPEDGVEGGDAAVPPAGECAG